MKKVTGVITWIFVTSENGEAKVEGTIYQLRSAEL